MAETGTASMGMGFTRMPTGATFYNQTLWGSIGWATPAAFGAGIAAPHQRVVLITGEGAHQFTVQEISQFARYGLKPVIFVLNNAGYLIERLLCKEPDIALQRHRVLALRRAAPRLRLRQLVHRARLHLRRTRRRARGRRRVTPAAPTSRSSPIPTPPARSPSSSTTPSAGSINRDFQLPAPAAFL